jgi:hypothetical protein
MQPGERTSLRLLRRRITDPNYEVRPGHFRHDRSRSNAASREPTRPSAAIGLKVSRVSSARLILGQAAPKELPVRPRPWVETTEGVSTGFCGMAERRHGRTVSQRLNAKPRLRFLTFVVKGRFILECAAVFMRAPVPLLPASHGWRSYLRRMQVLNQGKSILREM